MEKLHIKKMDLKRFNTLAAQSRSPAAAYVSKELGACPRTSFQKMRPQYIVLS